MSEHKKRKTAVATATQDASPPPTKRKKGSNQEPVAAPIKSAGGHAPAVHQILSDNLTQLSLEYWARNSGKALRPFDPKIVEDIYFSEINPDNFNLSRIMLLELSFYLENYLWPNFDSKNATRAHMMSILIMVNEKFRENISAWTCFHVGDNAQVQFGGFWDRVLALPSDPNMTVREKTIYTVFLINCYQSLSDELVGKQALRLVSLPLWYSLNDTKLELELEQAPKIQKLWKALQKKDSKTSSRPDVEKTFLPSLIQDYFTILSSITEEAIADPAVVSYCERFVEFVTDLANQLRTRRFFRVVLEDTHFVVRSKFSALHGKPEGKLFRQLLQILHFYERFEIDDYSGLALSQEEMTKRHYDALKRLQVVAYKSFPELKKIALANVGSIDSREGLTKALAPLSDARLAELASTLGFIGAKSCPEANTRKFIEEVMVVAYERRTSQIDALNNRSLYPDETIIWDENVVPSANFVGTECLALPKLNLQYLTLHDHLLRNFTLFRLESTYEIRQDLQDVIRRLQPRKNKAGTTLFKGWARMASPIARVAITRVGKPNIGEYKPSVVIAEVTINLPNNYSIRNEWESIRSHDVLFLMTFDAAIAEGESADTSLPFPQQYGLKYFRGGEVFEILDERGRLINENDATAIHSGGNRRTFRLKLDAAQYQLDSLRREQHGGEDVYTTFNIVFRRKSKENNFKAVLETIRDLMNTKMVVPDWLRDVFLGYGNPAASQNIESAKTIDFVDTFIDSEHLRAAFPEYKIKFASQSPIPPFRVSFDGPTAISVESYKVAQFMPYSAAEQKRNHIPFTTVQVKAIQTAMNKGLTMVVGPPGTGKTDVAVQIISNWYHNYPGQRTLLVTHSNNALNQLFEKIADLDIDERHLVRLGHGEKALDTEKDFSKQGRVNHMLQMRLDLLQEVEKLASSLDHPTDVGYSCETAHNYFVYNILAKWEKFLAQALEEKSTSGVKTTFPFTKFFADASQPLFLGESFDADLSRAESSFKYIRGIFERLDECRAFELLKSSYDRGNYVVTKQARLIAMTCTHAALTRSQLVQLGFKFDNILMEEAAQILEIETFIPMLLQEQDPEAGARLKRVVMIGDHNQLPPIVQNMAFQKFGHLDQSLFARFVRLGVPTINLDAQGRARPDIAALYNWRYETLANLSHVIDSAEFKQANPGFAHDFQLVNVEDYEGHGEIEPTPYFYQNLGEAEYVVATFMYMRMIGYPANKISIITSYNGQKHLIRDIIRQRCAWNPAFGQPHKITTVDRYQGQQNDYVLLSLVRTKTVGHIRDVRRLVVAMSRARLGLYVFCRKDLFKDCYELTQTFSKLLQRPDKLQLVKGEQFNNCVRQVDQAADQNNVFQVEDVIHMGQIVTPAQAIAPPPQALVVADEAEVVGDLPEENFPTHPDTEMKDE